MENYIKLASTTEAMRAKNILFKHGIRSQVKRISSKGISGNCSFGIVTFAKTDKVYDILEKYHIYPQGRAYGDNDDVSG